MSERAQQTRRRRPAITVLCAYATPTGKVSSGRTDPAGCQANISRDQGGRALVQFPQSTPDVLSARWVVAQAGPYSLRR